MDIKSNQSEERSSRNQSIDSKTEKRIGEEGRRKFGKKNWPENWEIELRERFDRGEKMPRRPEHLNSIKREEKDVYGQALKTIQDQINGKSKDLKVV